ncbi:MAG: hypothetical protein AB8B88_04905 [Devosiaceae bacterium]
MIPLVSAPSAPPPTGTGRVATPVAPVSTAPAVGGSAGQAAAPAPPPTSGQPSQVSAQALLTLLQTLGKPISGTVLPTGSNPTSSLSLQLATPASGGSNSNTLTTRLPLPQGSARPAIGTPVMVHAEGDANAPRLAVTITGTASASAETLRTDASRQASLAPLMADIARLGSNAAGSKQINQAIEKLLGFTIKADAGVNSSALRGAIEGAAGTASAATTAQSLGQPSQGMQNALGALIKALGLTLPNTNAEPSPQATSNPATLGAQAKPGQMPASLGTSSNGTPSPSNGAHALPPPSGNQPTKASPTPLPSLPSDLSDPAVLTQLKSKAEGALSRLNLMQSGETTSATRGGEAAAGMRWDVPVLIGQEVALLGVMIEQDSNGTGTDGQRILNWRFRFAFESQALGGVEGVVALHQPVDPASPTGGISQNHLDIAVWAADPTVLAKLEMQRRELVVQLQALGLAIDSLTLAPAQEHPESIAHSDSINTHHLDLSS